MPATGGVGRREDYERSRSGGASLQGGYSNTVVLTRERQVAGDGLRGTLRRATKRWEMRKSDSLVAWRIAVTRPAIPGAQVALYMMVNDCLSRYCAAPPDGEPRASSRSESRNTPRDTTSDTPGHTDSEMTSRTASEMASEATPTHRSMKFEMHGGRAAGDRPQDTTRRSWSDGINSGVGPTAPHGRCSLPAPCFLLQAPPVASPVGARGRADPRP